ncbi:MAG: class I SAM-dependent methyltransferase [Cellvibrionales bacterium]|nr:class I SAM-dependent methyltransferase [Cellvibrionales bacterium]
MPHPLKLSATEKAALAFVQRVLSRLQQGHLRLIIGDTEHHYGEPAATARLHAQAQIHDGRALTAILRQASIGVGESYMQGHWSTPDLTALVRLMVLNLAAFNRLDHDRPWPLRLLHRLSQVRPRSNRRAARRNIAAHYDLSNDFFALFLDPTMTYSCALFPRPDSSLEQASIHKVKTLCDKLQLTERDHLLEIGTGWGFLARYAAQHYGCRVTTTTLSEQQYQYARQQIRAHNLENQIQVLRRDYRDLTGTYDKLVSVEMIEAVGHRHFDRYFATCDRLLKPHGLMALQAITIADQHYQRATRYRDFIQKHIFPGGGLPGHTVIADCLRRKTTMQILTMQDIGADYARTLKIWRRNFLNRLDEVRKLGFDDSFIRMWEYYLCYCEGGFLERSISATQMLIAAPNWHPS